MDTRLVRVVCASCEANYRIGADAVRGKVVDYCCSNCGAVIEVDGTAIELVAPTRPGLDPREKLPRTPEPAMVEPTAAAFNVNTPVWRSDTPAGRSRQSAASPHRSFLGPAHAGAVVDATADEHAAARGARGRPPLAVAERRPSAG